jgi:HPt (histidine-containing phosphotransfer) domain-containing protein
MDVQMPVLDGLEATRVIRAQSLGVDIRIVAMTAGAFESDRKLCLEAGMDDFVAKPIQRNTLRQVLRNVAAQKAGAPEVDSDAVRGQERLAIPDSIVLLLDNATTREIDTRMLKIMFSELGSQGTNEILELFLKQSPQNIDRSLLAMKNGEFGDLRRVLHILRSNFSTIGAIGLATECAEIERLLISTPQSTLGERLTQIALRYRRLSEELQGLLESLRRSPNSHDM